MTSSAPLPRAEQLDRAVSIAANMAYLLVVASILALMFPGLRKGLAGVGRRILYDYQLGLWLGHQPPRAPVPAWVRHVTRQGAELPTELEPDSAE